MLCKSLQNKINMKNIIAGIFLIFFSFKMEAQLYPPMRYSDTEWQQMMQHLDSICEVYQLSVVKKYRKRKIKKDLKIINVLNEILKDNLNVAEVKNILVKNKIKIHYFSSNEKLNWTDCSLTGGYMTYQLNIETRHDKPDYGTYINIGNSYDNFYCDETSAQLLNFYYVYTYLRPSMDFKLGFDEYEGVFKTAPIR